MNYNHKLNDKYNPKDFEEKIYKETEEKGIGECIIAKQRNGPVGTVKLAWLGQYSRFGNLDLSDIE